jgi:hypothetical protein
VEFVRLHLVELHLDPFSGDPVFWHALLAALGEEGVSCEVETLRAPTIAPSLAPTSQPPAPQNHPFGCGRVARAG